MRFAPLCRAAAASLVCVTLLACSRAPQAPAAPAGARPAMKRPLLKVSLVTVTLASVDPAVAAQVEAAGYGRAEFQANYPEGVKLEAALWQVPEAVAARAVLYQGPVTPDLRILPVAPQPAPAADEAATKAFFHDVLGTVPPAWPAGVTPSPAVRIHAVTYLSANLADARDKLKGEEIPFVVAPTSVTTPYLADHDTLAIRAPDGTLVELVQPAL